MPHPYCNISDSIAPMECLEALFAFPHRFTFNGQERTDEIAGTGNHNTALYWEYDTRLGRRWNVDPLTTEFPWQSGYSSLDNNPVLLTDLFGASADHYEVDKETGESKYVKDQFGEDFVFTLFGEIDEKGVFTRRAGDAILVHNSKEEGWEKAKSFGLTLNKFEGGYTLPYYRPGYKPDYTFSDVSQQIIWSTAVTLATADIPLERIVSGAIGIFAKTSKPVLDVAAKTGTSLLKPLGLGSTGRTVAANLTEQLAMKEIMSNPSSGKVLIEKIEDARWIGWSKMSNKTAHGVEIHYNALWENGVVKAIDDFKFIGGK